MTKLAKIKNFAEGVPNIETSQGFWLIREGNDISNKVSFKTIQSIFFS